MTTTKLGTPGYKRLRAEYNIMCGDEDVWGLAMEWWFAVAEFLYHNEPSMVPAEWKFRDSPMYVPPFCPDDLGMTDARIWEMYDCEEITLEDALAFGRVLTRYARMLEKLGMSY